MMSSKYDIKDDELRVIGKPAAPLKTDKDKKKNKWLLAAMAVIVLLCGYLYYSSRNAGSIGEDNEEGLLEQIVESDASAVVPEVKSRLGNVNDMSNASYTEKIDTTINDIPLSIYIPHNAVAELCLGQPDMTDSGIVFCAQAADIRKDNNKIVGGYVIKGQPLAWGLSKKGYCSIIDNKITIGTAQNSPLFEEATEKEGYFFRQYPLVNNRTIVENEIKNKSYRRALCDRYGEIFIVESNTKESFHDFSQALVDLDVDNAIYLVGGVNAKGWYRNVDMEIVDLTRVGLEAYKYENYIVWRDGVLN
ncbi:MAG: hypothetical protein J6Q34_02390 [Bacteroidales bacterium]|nr:hypothetical protein [Bacteroidales bacterium]